MELIFNCRNYAEVKKVQLATAVFYGDALSWWNQLVKSRRLDRKEPVETWHKLRALMRREFVPRQYHREVLRKQSETKLNPLLLDQKPLYRKSSTPAGSSSKPATCFSEEKRDSNSSLEVKQFCLSRNKKEQNDGLERRLNSFREHIHHGITASHLSLEEQNQESFTTDSELKEAEPEPVVPIQEDQTKASSSTIQKEEQPVPDVMVSIIQDVIVEETPKETQAEIGLEQIVVFDPYGLQKTFLDTFLISPFIWNKTRAMEISRHDLGMKHVVFEPGGELWIHRNNTKLIEKEAAAETFDFGDLLASGERLLHVSAQQEFHYETNWRMSPTLSWIQQTRPRSKWPPDHQDIANFVKHIGLDQFCEMLISDYAGRLQTYSWRPGAYVRKIIILGECSSHARTSWGHKEFEADKNALPLNHIKIWKPPDMEQPQYYCRDYQIMMGNRGVTGEIGEVITGSGEELVFSSQIKEKPPDELSLQPAPKQPIRGIYLNSKKNMKPDLLAVGTGKNILRSTLLERSSYIDQIMNDEYLAKLELQQRNLETCLAASFDIGAVRGSYLINQKELGHETNCIGNLTHQANMLNWNHVQNFSAERVMGSTTQVILSVLCLNFAEFRTSQTYLWRPGEHAKVSDHVFKYSFMTDYTDMMALFLSKEPCAGYKRTWKHTRRNYMHEEDKRFKPPNLDQDKHPDVTGFILIKETPPDASFKPKPSRNKFGIRLLLLDKFLCANLFCFNVSGVRRIKRTSIFYITEPISNRAYQLDLQGKYNISSSFNITDFVSYHAGEMDLRSNPSQVGEDDVIFASNGTEEKEQLEPELEPELEDEGEGTKEQLEPEETKNKDLSIPLGPMTRSRQARFQQALQQTLHTIQGSLEYAYPTTLVVIQAT